VTKATQMTVVGWLLPPPSEMAIYENTSPDYLNLGMDICEHTF